MTKERVKKRLRGSRYAVKMLFAYFGGGLAANGLRVCEERIVLLDAPGISAAYTEAMKRGRRARFKFKNNEGDQVEFDFLGIIDICELGIECETDEVWYQVKKRRGDRLRLLSLIPSKEELIGRVGPNSPHNA